MLSALVYRNSWSGIDRLFTFSRSRIIIIHGRHGVYGFINAAAMDLGRDDIIKLEISDAAR